MLHNMNQQNGSSERRVIIGKTQEQAYSLGYDCGFRAGFLEGCQSGYAQGYDDATKKVIMEGGF
jgi:hypothetical protein